ncbi:hypothetical protein LJC49_07905 [Ruminococcaceae bacterium OttesenSCG-928-I18]|nr:hypothetical protein [Ruminococcaceae bacterium OttesenSCG-928-I18]
MKSALSGLRGNALQKEALQRALQKGELPHAILLTAPDGCGRNYAARCLAADYLFPQGGPAAVAVHRGQSPEVLLIEGEGLSGQIKIDRVRQVRGDLFHTGLSSAGRVVLIRDAESMMAPAANALLKVLEEPPGEVLFILTARDAAALPATIRSRCALYPLLPVPNEECAQVLQDALAEGQSPELPGFLAAVYGGRIGLGLRAIQSPERLQVLRDAATAAKASAQNDRYELMRIFSGYEGRGEEERNRRSFLLGDLFDVLAAALRQEPGFGEKQGYPGKAPVCRFLPLVQEAAQALTRNASPKLTLTTLAVKLTNR